MSRPDPFTERADERERMVRDQIAARGLGDPRVLAALGRVPRHRFVPPESAHQAYGDGPLPIGYGQTVSQPYVVACMTAAASLGPGERVLEIGAGSGYQTAVLAELGAEVLALEIVPELARDAAGRLADLGYDVRVEARDGGGGDPGGAPWDVILSAAAPVDVPRAWTEQLAPGGRLILPLGAEVQDLVVLRRSPGGLTREVLFPVRFVPLTGAASGSGRRPLS